MTQDRRKFLKRAAAVAAGSVVAASDAGAQRTPAPPVRRALDPGTLAAVGDAVLPESLGAAGRTKAVRAFSAWVAAYQPVAEEMHGYGDAEITYTPADPAPGWNAQLEALDLLSRRKFRRGFAAIDTAKRRELLAAQIGRAGARLPSIPLQAAHVAVALMAHWADSSEATDFVYGVSIGKGECRILAQSSRKPLPLAGGAH
jgi:hypothetical protein